MRAIGAGERFRRERGYGREPSDAEQHAASLTQARVVLGEAALGAALREGEALGLDEAAALLLAASTPVRIGEPAGRLAPPDGIGA